MDYVHRLPFISGASMAIIIGLVSYNSGIDAKTIYIRMSISLVAFFALGLYLRGFIYKISEEVRKKKEEEELREMQQEEENQRKEKEKSEHIVDLRIDDDSYEIDISPDKENEKLYDEEFTPLSVNSVSINEDVELK